MYKIFSSIIFSLAIFSLHAEIKGYLDIKPVFYEFHKIDDSDVNYFFNGIGSEIECDFYLQNLNRLRLEPKFHFAMGNHMEFHEESVQMGYYFNPIDKWIVKPYFGIKNRFLRKRYNMLLDYEFVVLDCKYKNWSLYSFIGTNFQYCIQDDLRLKFDILMGLGKCNENQGIPHILHELYPNKSKSQPKFADVSFEINYQLPQGSFIITKIGSNISIDKLGYGFLCNYISLGYKISF